MEQSIFQQIIFPFISLVLGWLGGNIWRLLTFKREQRRSEMEVGQRLWTEIERLQNKLLEVFKTFEEMEQQALTLKKENRKLEEERDIWKETADKFRAQLTQVSQECELLKTEILKLRPFRGNAPEMPETNFS